MNERREHPKSKYTASTTLPVDSLELQRQPAKVKAEDVNFNKSSPKRAGRRRSSLERALARDARQLKTKFNEKHWFGGGSDKGDTGIVKKNSGTERQPVVGSQNTTNAEVSPLQPTSQVGVIKTGETAGTGALDKDKVQTSVTDASEAGGIVPITAVSADKGGHAKASSPVTKVIADKGDRDRTSSPENLKDVTIPGSYSDGTTEKYSTPKGDYFFKRDEAAAPKMMESLDPHDKPAALHTASAPQAGGMQETKPAKPFERLEAHDNEINPPGPRKASLTQDEEEGYEEYMPYGQGSEDPGATWNAKRAEQRRKSSGDSASSNMDPESSPESPRNRSRSFSLGSAGAFEGLKRRISRGFSHSSNNDEEGLPEDDGVVVHKDSSVVIHPEGYAVVEPRNDSEGRSFFYNFKDALDSVHVKNRGEHPVRDRYGRVPQPSSRRGSTKDMSDTERKNSRKSSVAESGTGRRKSSVAESGSDRRKSSNADGSSGRRKSSVGISDAEAFRSLCAKPNPNQNVNTPIVPVSEESGSYAKQFGEGKSMIEGNMTTYGAAAARKKSGGAELEGMAPQGYVTQGYEGVRNVSVGSAQHAEDMHNLAAAAASAATAKRVISGPQAVPRSMTAEEMQQVKAETRREVGQQEKLAPKVQGIQPTKERAI
ncbi:LAMI_0F14004g1_1 [Lachancea mirantina]|uniref:LAMI_0F14004g1_1 n=1 Tax=Lachancea mirantina TaxID=1230905 RepID=A0A1G4K3L9_9SACH|nr:LAMI_0F14004g1_1 [Lachancea mirantina]